jgi:hypothetical protein
MKKEATPKHKGLKSKTFDKKQRQSQKPKNSKCWFTKASFVKPTLEGEGDAFWFQVKREMTTTNCMMAISKPKKSGTVGSPKLASLNQRLKTRVTLFGFNSNAK